MCKSEIVRKEGKLREVRSKMETTMELLVDSDLLCPTCNAPLSTRGYLTIYGHVGDKEIEAEVEFVECQCGYAHGHDGDVSACGRAYKAHKRLPNIQ